MLARLPHLASDLALNIVEGNLLIPISPGWGVTGNEEQEQNGPGEQQ